MCGGSKGPSAMELAAQSDAAKAAAQAEAAKIKAAADLEKQKAAQALLAGQVSQANADAARRARNRTLLAGIQAEEGPLGAALAPAALAPAAPLPADTLEDPALRSTKKAARASTLLAGLS